MGRKNKSSKEYVFEDTNDAEDDAHFASRLLAGLKVEQGKHEKTDEEVEYADSVPKTPAKSSASSSEEQPAPSRQDSQSTDEIKHPHLHQIHEGLHSLLHPFHSSSHNSSHNSSSHPSAPDSTVSSARASGEVQRPGTTQSAEHAPAASQRSSESGPAEAGGDGKKRNRRREKLRQREEERAKLVQEAEAEAKTVPDKRAIELKGMGMMITKAGLVEFEVAPDGHCLFHSLADQLQQRRDVTVTAQDLRSAFASYIRKHPDDFVPYLIEDETGEVVNINKYTDDLEHTGMWGGDCEILAASRIYEVPIAVHFATHAPLVINEEDYPEVERFHLAFYEQKFGLGAHYNSLRNAHEGDRAYEYRQENEDDEGWTTK